MSKFHSATSLTTAFNSRFAKSGTVDLQASADKNPVKEPDFGGEVDIQAAGVVSFNGKTTTSKVLSHFLVLGNTITEGSVIELPDADFARMGPDGTGQVREATQEEIAEAQKATKGK